MSCSAPRCWVLPVSCWRWYASCALVLPVRLETALPTAPVARSEMPPAKVSSAGRVPPAAGPTGSGPGRLLHSDCGRKGQHRVGDVRLTEPNQSKPTWSRSCRPTALLRRAHRLVPRAGRAVGSSLATPDAEAVKPGALQRGVRGVVLGLSLVLLGLALGLVAAAAPSGCRWRPGRSPWPSRRTT